MALALLAIIAGLSHFRQLSCQYPFEDYLARILIVEREAKAFQLDSEYISADQPRHRNLLLQSRGEPYISYDRCRR